MVAAPTPGERSRLVKRHWQVDPAIKALAKDEARRAGSPSMARWLNEAIRDYIAAHPAPAERIRPPAPDAIPALSDTQVETLKALAENEDPVVLNLWIAALADIGWPVSSVVAPVLGVSAQRVAARVALGRAAADEGLVGEREIPPVAVPPMWWNPGRQHDSREDLVSLVPQVDDTVAKALDDYVDSTGRIAAWVVEAAIRWAAGER